MWENVDTPSREHREGGREGEEGCADVGKWRAAHPEGGGRMKD